MEDIRFYKYFTEISMKYLQKFNHFLQSVDRILIYRMSNDNFIDITAYGILYP